MSKQNGVLENVLAHIDSDQENSLQRLFSFIRIASISTDPAYAAECRSAANHLAQDLRSIGFDAALRETEGHPVILGEASGAGGPSVLFYGHYDVQPVDPVALWDKPPFEPGIAVIEGGRQVITGRGACDDKGQVMTFVEACRAWKTVTGSLPLGITMLIEGEEECGSKNLFPFVRAHAGELRRDVALVCDTGMWNATTPAVTTSLRGLLYVEIRVRCADRDLHSGLFGGAAQNPIHIVGRIVADLHDEGGRITLPGFYDGVPELPADIKADLAALDLTEEDFLGTVGLKKSAGEKGRMLIEQISTRPTCDVNGIWGGYAGEGSKTVIAAETSAKISFRLVGDQDPEAISTAFREFVRERIPSDCSVEFITHASSPAIQLPYDNVVLARAREALAAEWGTKAVTIGSGGSIPIVGDFKRVLGMDSLLVGFGLDDDRVHSPNEKYELTSFHKGIRSWARIIGALAE